MGENLKDSSSFPENSDGKKWEDHFKNLFTEEVGDIDKILKKKETQPNQVLNKEFTLEEIKTTISNLKK